MRRMLERARGGEGVWEGAWEGKEEEERRGGEAGEGGRERRADMT